MDERQQLIVTKKSFNVEVIPELAASLKKSKHISSNFKAFSLWYSVQREIPLSLEKE
jgi:hypothetical protein